MLPTNTPLDQSRFSIQYPLPQMKNQLVLQAPKPHRPNGGKGVQNQRRNSNPSDRDRKKSDDGANAALGSIFIPQNSQMDEYLGKSVSKYSSEKFNTRFNRASMIFTGSNLKTSQMKDSEKSKEEFNTKAYPISYCMMFGLNHISNTQKLKKREKGYKEKIPESIHFSEKITLPFPSTGSVRHGTPPHQIHDFKFTEYTPVVFRALRRLHGISESAYQKEINVDSGFIEFSTNSKSGSFFYHTEKGGLIVKSASNYEADLLLRLLPSYYEHLSRNSESLLVRFCGLYYISVPNLGSKVHFVVMKSVYSYAKNSLINKIYDLKGSTVGRKAKPTEDVKKDLDIKSEINSAYESFNGLVLGRYDIMFLRVLQKDTVYLSKHNIMDYSLLLAIYDTGKFKRESKAYNVNSRSFQHFAQPVMRQKKTARQKPKENKRSQPQFAAFRVGDAVSNFGRDGESDAYYMGIIDILQEYTWKKRIENTFKSLRKPKEKNNISAVNSKKYAKRFNNFMSSIIDDSRRGGRNI
eukprot:augustus_masked-scaffold_15-processed-gene-9.53-mRNA-1 protein AED:0.17 eAED:0.19 QI:0/-1/0/1/-1/1/1/0/521